MSKINNGGLDQYGAGPFEQQQFGTAGVEEVKSRLQLQQGTAVNLDAVEIVIMARNKIAFQLKAN